MKKWKMDRNLTEKKIIEEIIWINQKSKMKL